MEKVETTKLTLSATLLFLVLIFNLSAQNVGINATGATPDASALLDLSSTDKGFLITRVDTANIPSPAFGLMTLAPIDTCLYLYNGIKWMGLGGGGRHCSCNCATPLPIPYCGVDTITLIVDVTSATGKVWMDRNLGSDQVATSSSDAASYGDLYQWGRCSDGHEKRTSITTTTPSSSDTPGHSDFIMIGGSPGDWRSPQNANLWQGVNGINNPCPSGYRLPTKVEWDTEVASWSSQDAAGAIGSVLKLPLTGYRINSNGSVWLEGSSGHYWSSAAPSGSAQELRLNISVAVMNFTSRSYGAAVRCIKD